LSVFNSVSRHSLQTHFCKVSVSDIVWNVVLIHSIDIVSNHFRVVYRIQKVICT